MKDQVDAEAVIFAVRKLAHLGVPPQVVAGTFKWVQVISCCLSSLIGEGQAAWVEEYLPVPDDLVTF